MTIAADKNACNEVLNTLKLYREHIGAPSTMGLAIYPLVFQIDHLSIAHSSLCV